MYNKSNKFEFLLSLEDNIICQRFFSVKQYRAQNRKSLELNDTMREIINTIKADLKDKSIDYLIESYDMNTHTVNLSPQDQNNTCEENFHVILKVGNETISKFIFPSNIYPAKIRYTVDIRPRLTKFLSMITDELSRKKITTTYLETQL